MATPEMQIYLANIYCLPAGAEGRGLAGGSWRRREAKTNAMLSPPPRLPAAASSFLRIRSQRFALTSRLPCGPC